ncbi:MAG: hypothetical protein P1P88_05925 [Bacteroidales bacterium]|nr:hypothetical protein [Bacteroidales bacterium]
MKSVLITIFSLTLMISIKGQYTRLELTELGLFSSENHGQAKIYFNQEIQLKDILISKANATKEYQVWRVQIYLGSGKNARNIATATRNTFIAKYPDIGADIAYPSPYFKVQAGNFKTRIEAESFRKKILGEYPNCRVELITNKED